MKQVRLALYKGWPAFDLVHTLSHVAICLRSLSKYSHVELEIDGVCYSSSARDKGVRSKQIDLSDGKWNLFEITLDVEELEYALAVFHEHEGKPYDWNGVLRFVFPFVKQKDNQLYCSELVAKMLDLPETEIFPSDLLDYIGKFQHVD